MSWVRWAGWCADWRFETSAMLVTASSGREYGRWHYRPVRMTGLRHANPPRFQCRLALDWIDISYDRPNRASKLRSSDGEPRGPHLLSLGGSRSATHGRRENDDELIRVRNELVVDDGTSGGRRRSPRTGAGTSALGCRSLATPGPAAFLCGRDTLQHGMAGDRNVNHTS
jgi:hypothetical protein